jgi:hypothetical protein
VTLNDGDSGWGLLKLNGATPQVNFYVVSGVDYVALSVIWSPNYLLRICFTELFLDRNVLWDETTCLAAAIAVLAIVIRAGYLLCDSGRSGVVVPFT